MTQKEIARHIRMGRIVEDARRSNNTFYVTLEWNTNHAWKANQNIVVVGAATTRDAVELAEYRHGRRAIRVVAA